MIQARNGREWVVRLQDGEDLVEVLRTLGHESALILMGIGMVREAELGYWNGTNYDTHERLAPSELVSLQGNLAPNESGDIIVHAHVAVSDQDGLVSGGHLMRAVVHNTVEMALLPLTGIDLERRPESTGLVGLFPRTR